MAVLVFALRLFFYSRLHVFGTFSLFFVLELIAYYAYFISRKRNGKQHDVETIEEVIEHLDQENLPFELDQIRKNRQSEIFSCREKVCDRLLKDYPNVCDFIDRHINLDKIDETDSVVLNTHTIFNVETIDDHDASLFINLHKVNDFRWLNSYFLEVHKKIYNGGYFIGQGETIRTRKKRFYSKFPKILADILYPINFLMVRVLPKLPGFDKLYFFLTRGKNRAISQAEILGRLCFCGFRIVAAEEIDNSLYFIAQRAKTPSLEKNPSYGPFIKLRRIGYNHEVMYINKFRTMHPYSEFLQEHIFEQHDLAEGGKIFNDFRLTSWGQFFRKMWIDELPQVINFFQGDLNLVGVRALSQHYFGLYPKDMQELRTQFKPGLVPPYYADLPKNLDEIIESERRYLEAKQENPFTTDIKYFFRAWYNILFKRARSR
jgi:lipopolysaccharide/colanic/teichoic acid biosynthesis glycosyltransferase